jgi:hypothetical protein
MQILANWRCRWAVLASWIVVTSLASVIGYTQSNTVLYQGARLIIGDASTPIETGEFLVQNGRITAIGPKGSIHAPARASRIDLTGKTVMPTMNNVHIHIGYEGYVSWSVENHTRENVLDHLEREAFYGVGTAMTMGDQPPISRSSSNKTSAPGNFRPQPGSFSRQVSRLPVAVQTPS